MKNERGNSVEESFVMGERYQFDFVECTAADGWVQYDTSQDASYFGVWVHVEDRKIVTFCEGDLYTTTCPTVKSFKAELANMAKFYGEPPPAFTVIDGEGKVTFIFDERPE